MPQYYDDPYTDSSASDDYRPATTYYNDDYANYENRRYGNYYEDISEESSVSVESYKPK